MTTISRLFLELIIFKVRFLEDRRILVAIRLSVQPFAYLMGMDVKLLFVLSVAPPAGNAGNRQLSGAGRAPPEGLLRETRTQQEFDPNDVFLPQVLKVNIVLS